MNSSGSTTLIFNSVTLEHFMSFESATLNLKDAGQVLLQGINEQDVRSDSNGSGKSALVSESIVWCLTGFTTRGTKEVSNIITGVGAMVSVNVLINGIEYVISRGERGSSIGHTVSVVKDGIELNVAGNITNGRAVLESELGGTLDWSTLTSSIVLAQGMQYALTAYSSSDRKVVLETLGGTEEIYLRVKSEVANSVTRYKNVVASHGIEISKLLGSITSLEGSITSAEENKVRLLEMDSNKRPEDQVKGMISDTESLITKLKSEIQLEESEQSKIHPKLQELNPKMIELNTQKSAILESYNSYTREVNQATTNHTKLLNDIESLKTTLSKLEDHLCLECGQPVHDEYVNNKRSELNKSIEDTTKLAEDAKIELDKLLASPVSNDTSEVDGLISTTQSSINELNTQYSTISSTLNVKRMELSTAESTLRNLNQELQSLGNSVLDLTPYDNIIRESRAKITEHKLALDTINVTKEKDAKLLELAEWYDNRVAKRIRPFLLSGIINFINTRTSEYSPSLFSSSVVKLALEKDKIEIYLGNRKSESLSGGERRRVDIIVQLALRDMILIDSGIYSNLLVVDEALDYLDASGINSVVDLLTSQRSQLDSLFMITHKADADIPYTSRVVVVKDAGGLSSIKDTN